VPETKGKSEAEIQEYFDPKPKTWIHWIWTDSINMQFFPSDL
jgi:hypothetical protein